MHLGIFMRMCDVLFGHSVCSKVTFGHVVLTKGAR